jgi:putative flavoprotein involved in K+ transport
MDAATAVRNDEKASVSLAETMARAGRFVEPGAALHTIDRNTRGRADAERFDAIVVGAGQSGLSVGYHLARLGLRFVILDAHARIGDVWRQRWDSLRVFTPARFCGLDGMRFPASAGYFPTKDEMGDFLLAYARAFDLPVRNDVRVDAVRREGDHYVVEAGAARFETRHVVIAAASYQQPKVPAFAAALDPSIRQIHSNDYKNPAQLKPGTVLLVGAANSGGEIAMDLVKTHTVLLAGKHPGEIPVRTHTWFATRVVAPIVFRVLFHRLLSVDTPIGRKARPNFFAHGAPLVRVKARDLVAAGVRRVPRIVDVRNGQPVLQDGRPVAAENVIWCTGFRHGLDWVKRPIFDASGRPQQYRGVIEGEPGLYIVGLSFQHAPSSTMIHGVGRDARRVVEAIAKRVRATRAPSLASA